MVLLLQAVTFFFKGHRHHRDLHSFPTRRSSDLEQRLREHQQRVDRLQRPGQQLANVVRDRKSTRLNSSHLGISYAVFCLKKKKSEVVHHVGYRVDDVPETLEHLRSEGVTLVDER